MVDGGCTATLSLRGGGEANGGRHVAREQQHQALYRRYRPQTPAEVLGQDHVVRALTGAIREDRFGSWSAAWLSRYRSGSSATHSAA